MKDGGKNLNVLNSYRYIGVGSQTGFQRILIILGCLRQPLAPGPVSEVSPVFSARLQMSLGVERIRQFRRVDVFGLVTVS